MIHGYFLKHECLSQITYASVLDQKGHIKIS